MGGGFTVSGDWLVLVADPSKAVTFDFEWGLLVIITPTAAGGLAFGTIPTDTLVAASFSPAERRFGSVPSDEVVNPAAGARRLGAVPTDELVPNS